MSTTKGADGHSRGGNEEGLPHGTPVVSADPAGGCFRIRSFDIRACAELVAGRENATATQGNQ